ncbi:DUF6785 family protein, partial [Thermodesulfobacteriota bacterium]
GLLGVVGYNVPAAALGVTFGPTLSRPEETQMIGAYGVFFLFIVWLARFHLLDVVRYSFGSRKVDLSRAGWFNPRISFWAFCIGVMGIIAWFRYFGMPIVPAVLMIGASFMVMIVAGRVICQGGVAYFTLTAAPIDGLLALFGPKMFAGAGIALAGVVQKVLFVDLRESLFPSLVHARKVTQNMGSRRMILTGIFVTLLACVAVSFVSMLALCYRYGVRELQFEWATRTTLAVYDNINTLVQAPTRPGDWVLIFSLVGAVVMLLLVVGYHRFYWWPIHPIGYLTAYSSAMRILWFSFFVGWLCNTLCMRYGGVLLFKRLRYFFVGLIVGDFLMGGSWAMVGLFKYASYRVLPD